MEGKKNIQLSLYVVPLVDFSSLDSALNEDHRIITFETKSITTCRMNPVLRKEKNVMYFAIALFSLSQPC